MLIQDKCNCTNHDMRKKIIQQRVLGQFTAMQSESSTPPKLRVSQESGKITCSKYDKS